MPGKHTALPSFEEVLHPPVAARSAVGDLSGVNLRPRAALSFGKSVALGSALGAVGGASTFAVLWWLA